MRIRVAALLVLSALIVAACGDDEPGAEPTVTVATVDEQAGTDLGPGDEDTEAEEVPVEQTPADDVPLDEPERFDFTAVSPIVETFIGERQLNGAALVIVHRDYGIVGHQFWGVFDQNRVSLIASSSKMVTAGVLLRLQDDGLLDINTPIAEYVPWAGDHPEITTAQLLSNSSGLPGLLATAAYPEYLCVFTHDTTLQACAEAVMTTSADDAVVRPPDTGFDYGGAQWQVAGAVAEVVSGKSWTELINEFFVEPCGLEVFGFNNHFSQIPTNGFSYPPAFNADPSALVESENPNMEGGAYTNTTDYASLLLMHLRDGKCGDNQVLSVEALAAMHSDRIAAAYNGDAIGSGSGYGMGWWVDRATGRRSDGGAFGSVPWLDLEDGYGALLLTESDNGTASMLAAQLYDLIDDAVAAGV